MRGSALPDFSARQLEAVLALVEYGSFVAAAARLRISQPALTRSVKRLETELGVRLFDRTTRRVQVTAAGREFAAVAERMLNDLGITVQSVREVAQERRGLVVLSSVMSVAGALAAAPDRGLSRRPAGRGNPCPRERAWIGPRGCAQRRRRFRHRLCRRAARFRRRHAAWPRDLLRRDVGTPQACRPPQAQPGRSRRPADRGVAHQFAHAAHHRCGGGDGGRAAAPDGGGDPDRHPARPGRAPTSASGSCRSGSRGPAGRGLRAVPLRAAPGAPHRRDRLARARTDAGRVGLPGAAAARMAAHRIDAQILQQSRLSS